MNALLAAISVTSPLMLWGIAAVALPVMAHLLNRRVRRRIVFPTVQLLREASANQSRVFRLRRWILLTLRCAAIVLLACAFARPLWSGPRAAAADSAQGAVVILVLDVSASTAQRDGGVPLVQRLAGAAERALDVLESGRDVANIVYAGARPRPAYPRPIANLEALRQDLRNLQSTAERADLPAAIALAASMAAEHGGTGRIILFSDMQRTNWTDVVPAMRWARVTVVPIGSARATNTGLLRPAVRPARPIVGQPARLTVTVTNFADHPRKVRIAVTLGEQTVGTQSLELAAGASRDVALDVVFEEPGLHPLEISASADDLELDDRRYLVAEAIRQVRIVLVSDEATSQPTSAAYFISRALAPAGDASDAFEVVPIRSDEITGQSVSGAGAVILSDIALLTEVAAQELVDYVAGGGGVVMFCGAGPVSAHAAALQRRAGEAPLVPFQPLHPLEAGREGRPWVITQGAWTSTALRSFDETSRLALRDVPFYRVHAAGEPAVGAHILLRFADSTPALAALGHGRGTMMIANFSPAPTMAEMAKHGAFVALLHGMIDELRAPGSADRGALAGQPLSFTVAGGHEMLRVSGPQGRALAFTTSADPSGPLTLQTAAAAEPGFYAVTRDGQMLAMRPVNIDERESDLARIEVKDLPEHGDGPGVAVATATATPEELAGIDRGKPLWWWFILAAGAAAAMEMVLLCLWRR